MTELTLLTDAYYFEAIGQGEEIRHKGARGEFHNVDDSEALRLIDEGLAVRGRVAEADLPAAPAAAELPADDGVVETGEAVTLGTALTDSPDLADPPIG